MQNEYLDELYSRCASYLNTYGKILSCTKEALESGDVSRLSGYAELEFIYGNKLKSCVATIEGLLKNHGGSLPEHLRTLAGRTDTLSRGIQRQISAELTSVHDSLRDVQHRMRSVGASPRHGARSENRYINISV